MGVDFSLAAAVVGGLAGLRHHAWLALYGILLAVFFIDEAGSLSYNSFWRGPGDAVEHLYCRYTMALRLLLLLCRLRHVRGACADVLRTLPSLAAPLALCATHASHPGVPTALGGVGSARRR